MRPILLIMWTAFQSFTLRHNNNNNNKQQREDISFKASLWLSTQSGSFQFTSIAENLPN